MDFHHQLFSDHRDSTDEFSLVDESSPSEFSWNHEVAPAVGYENFMEAVCPDRFEYLAGTELPVIPFRLYPEISAKDYSSQFRKGNEFHQSDASTNDEGDSNSPKSVHDGGDCLWRAAQWVDNVQEPIQDEIEQKNAHFQKITEDFDLCSMSPQGSWEVESFTSSNQEATSEDGQKRKRRYNPLSKEQKMELAAERAEGATLKELAQKFPKPPKDLGRILRTLHSIKKAPGRKVSEPGLDRQLIGWLNEIQETREWRLLRNKGTALQNRAKELSRKEGFTASKGWLYAFLKRHHIKLNETGKKW
eukprot:CAMPEP_0115018554 /NCGR_PEP_ID=MMETSP0216-20121206/28886_1 /TAXON_ID=223996 /ORGANISM="Protocruzia adherens, Strain Boccale" /LENGTH=303 /DNA_ID=CAMNT_0002389793 /DNA_START=102 /DNA_END=1013 /DNA_ORIENTATION=+